LAICAGAALLFVVGLWLAIAWQSILAVIVALIGAVVLTAGLLQLTPRPMALTAPAPPSTRDIRLDRDVALARLSAALTARGRRVSPATAEAELVRYRADCAAEARRRADAVQEAVSL